MMLTLKQASEITGMSRRVIQEYEKSGLAIKPKKISDWNIFYEDEQMG